MDKTGTELHEIKEFQPDQNLENQESSPHKTPLRRQDTTRRKVKYHFKKLRNLFIFDSIIFGVAVILLALFAFGVVSVKKVLFLGIPFFCVFLSTLFFFGYIVWFDNGFRHDDEYTWEELQEMEEDYLTKGGHEANQAMKKKKKSAAAVKFSDKDQVIGERSDTSFLNGFTLGSQLESSRHQPENSGQAIKDLEIGEQEEDNTTIIQKLKNMATPTKKKRPDYETKWDKMTPTQRIDHHRRAVADRNEELEILKYAIYTRLFFTIISFLVSLICIPYVWEAVKNAKDAENAGENTESIPHDENYIDWSIVFPEDYEWKYTIHQEGFFLILIVGAVLSFFLILIGVKMYQFYKKLKEDVANLNDKEVPYGE